MSNKYKIVCAWCQKVMIESDSKEISHGICAPCKITLLNGLKKPDNEVDSFTDKVQVEEVFTYEDRLLSVIEKQNKENEENNPLTNWEDMLNWEYR